MPVDSYPEGVSGYGVYHMAGNVFEWWTIADPKYYRSSNAESPRRGQRLQLAEPRSGQGLARRPWLAQETSRTPVTDSESAGKQFLRC